MEKIYGLIGSPVSHSMSPAMHNDLFAFYQISARYHAFQVDVANLKAAINGIKALGISGFNVTIPHKVNVMPYLDEIEQVAANIGAVNTVVNVDGKLVGYNTDGFGYIQSLKLLVKRDIRQLRVLVIGAGGAARAIFISLAAEGVKNIDICNRTEERALQIINDCSFAVTSNAISVEYGISELGKYDIIINTTSVGMNPNVNESPLSLINLNPASLVSDIIYNPFETKLLKEAKAKGATIQNGIGMFVNQGALAFEKWTGVLPDIKRMEAVVMKKLGGTIC